MSGILNVRKPSGVTSRDVVNRVIKCLPGRKNKVGHAGTLDPLAEGVLVVCFGAATRTIEFVQQLPKTYTGVFELGKTSDTEDSQGVITPLVAPTIPTREQLSDAADSWIGECMQRPPAYSALKVDGARAHALARAGEEVELESRSIFVHSIEITEYAYPFFTLNTQCGKGTYVRSLGRDIAASVGSGAMMTSLVRTAIGDFDLQDSVDFEDLNRKSIENHCLKPLRAVAHLPQIVLADAQRNWIWSGGFLNIVEYEVGDLVAGVDRHGELVSVLRQHADELRPFRNFKREIK